MEKQNTPLQMAIDEFNRMKEMTESFKDVIFLDSVISVLQTKLPIEREVIEKVYLEAHTEGFFLGSNCYNKKYENGEDYFNQTFNPNPNS